MNTTERRQEICLSCDLKDIAVELSGLWHCPNPLCRGVGSVWFKKRLKEYEYEGKLESE